MELVMIAKYYHKLTGKTILMQGDMSMPKYYLAADGGGTKLQAVLYDQDLQIVRLCRATGVNTLFKPLETVRSNIVSRRCKSCDPEDDKSKFEKRYRCST